MKSEKVHTFWMLVLLAVCFRLVLTQKVDLWQSETLWLQRSAFDLAGSPLFCLLIRGWSRISHNEIWLRSLSCLFSVASVAMIYLLARRTFKGPGSIETGALAAFSPILCTAAWEVHPGSAEVFAAALWLFAFMHVLERRRGSLPLVLHGLAALVAMAFNVMLVLFALVQLVILLIYRFKERGVILRWFATVVAAGLLIVVFAFLSGDPVETVPWEAEPPARSPGSCDVSYLVTDISLGQLHAWRPLTPVFSLAPPVSEDPAVRERAIGSGVSSQVHWFFQGLQFMFLSSFVFAVILACLSLWKIRTWPLPVSVKRRALIEKVHNSAREAGSVLVLAFILPILYCSLTSVDLLQPFPERRLLFVIAPFLVLAGKGLKRFEWIVIRYSMVLILAIVSFLYTYSSTGLQETTHGIADVMAAIETDWHDGDALAADTFLLGPAAWYSSIDVAGVSEVMGDTQRLWVIEFAPPEGSVKEGVGDFLAHEGWPSRRFGGAEESFIYRPFSKETSNVKRHLFPNYQVTLYPRTR